MEAVTVNDLPEREVYEMRGASAELMSTRRYSGFFKKICLEQMDLIDELANDEENYFVIRKKAKAIKQDYLDHVDQLCSYLKKRIERPASDSEEDEFHPHDGSYTIQRTNV